jgi:hypothetical protein
MHPEILLPVFIPVSMLASTIPVAASFTHKAVINTGIIFSIRAVNGYSAFRSIVPGTNR